MNNFSMCVIYTPHKRIILSSLDLHYLKFYIVFFVIFYCFIMSQAGISVPEELPYQPSPSRHIFTANNRIHQKICQLLEQTDADLLTVSQFLALLIPNWARDNFLKAVATTTTRQFVWVSLTDKTKIEHTESKLSCHTNIATKQQNPQLVALKQCYIVAPILASAQLCKFVLTMH